MAGLTLPLTTEQFRRLPRSAAYKYEYFDGQAYLSPRPKYYHALLDLAAPAAAPPDGVEATAALRPVRPDDWEAFVPVFAAAFRGVPPFGGLEDGPRQEAARKSLRFTRGGGDGPWVEAASFVATADDAGGPLGAVLITLLPDTDPADWRSYHWGEPPPPDCLARGLGRPHLTWIFVSPLHTGQGVGTALLNAAARELFARGYKELASTFLLGNESSMLWHWRIGFRLLPHAASRRRPPGTPG